MTRIGLSRRTLIAGLPVALSACTTARQPLVQAALPPVDPMHLEAYAENWDEPFPIPAVDIGEVDPRFLRQPVAFRGPERPGSIVVDPQRRFLYLVSGEGTALRYGVGVGKEEGFNYEGHAVIGRKAEWPRWTPTAAMIRREPARYGPVAGGLDGGLDNPLGARALYLHRDGRDTHYRIHGTNEPWSIGRQVSSGCIRMFNQDVIDLYDRVPVGTPVHVLGSASADRTLRVLV